MKLLITGGCGFLGSNLAAHAIGRGDDLVVFDSLYRAGSVDNLAWLKGQGRFRHVHGDIRNVNDITRLIREFCPDAVFHLAGQVAMTTSIANPRMDFEVNVMGSHNLLEAVRLYCPEAAVLYSSTNKVYGDLEQYGYEETPTRYVCTDRRADSMRPPPWSSILPMGARKAQRINICSTMPDFWFEYGCLSAFIHVWRQAIRHLRPGLGRLVLPESGRKQKRCP